MGARQSEACRVIGISPRTLQRWRQRESLEDLRQGPQAVGNKLSSIEIDKLLKIINSPKYVDRPPSFIVPNLADQGVYLASESTIYRVIRRYKLNAHRGRSKLRTAHAKKEVLEASAPNQIWSWDITYLKSPIRGKYFYLYMYMDIFSRKIMGFKIFDRECVIYASDLAEEIFSKNNLIGSSIRLHSDNGGPMRGSIMRSTLQQLGVIPSFSRPNVSNDNPYSESLFKTLKYRPSYPIRPFKSLDDANAWVEAFVNWYNNEHLHSSLGFMSPEDVHTGQYVSKLKKRINTYEQAKRKKPTRWSQNIRTWKSRFDVQLYGYRN